jgi:hypothetical protein
MNNGPPGNGKSSLPGEDQVPRKKMKDLGQVLPDSAANASPTSKTVVVVRLIVGRITSYAARIGYRYAVGLLKPFRCAVCGKLALDPIGWLGRHKPLCGKCADPEVPGGDE